MGNVLNKNPIIVDTLSATALLTDDICINSIRVEDMTTAGHKAVVQDKNGNDIVTFNATGDNYDETVRLAPEHGQLKFYHGLLVPTLQSGRLVIDLA